jgi:putative hemolysin
MALAVELLTILALILVNGLFSMGELALISARQARLAVLEGQGVAGAATARRLAEDPQRFLPTVQVGITMVSILLGVVGGARLAERIAPLVARVDLLAPIASELSLALVVMLITFVTLVLGELVPKQLALRQPERVAALLARPIGLLARAAAPAVWLLGASSDLVLRLIRASPQAQPGVTEEELRAVLAEGAQTGVLEEEEHDMIARLLRLADKPVRAIMTPRTELVWLDRSDPPSDIIAILRSSPHSRFVVCDETIDNVVGAVRAKDLLDHALNGEPLSLAAALRTASIMPDTVSALDALERLRSDELGLALVFDEYGSFEGVVTAANVLHAIVGDPINPANLAGDGIEPVDGAMIADGMMPIDEMKSRLLLPDLPAEGSYHTLGGLVLALLRRVPMTGDRIVFGGWRFEVLEMDARRVARVRISKEAMLES